MAIDANQWRSSAMSNVFLVLFISLPHFWFMCKGWSSFDLPSRAALLVISPHPLLTWAGCLSRVQQQNCLLWHWTVNLNKFCPMALSLVRQLQKFRNFTFILDHFQPWKHTSTCMNVSWYKCAETWCNETFCKLIGRPHANAYYTLWLISLVVVTCNWLSKYGKGASTNYFVLLMILYCMVCTWCS